MNKVTAISLLAILLSCHTKQIGKKIGDIERIDPLLDSIIKPGTKAEIIAQGFGWSEGPLWVEKMNALIFSDIPKNKIYKWTPEKGQELYLTPSGYTGQTKRKGSIGSNGLILDSEGNLVICQQGNRQMAKMDASINQPAPKFISIASKFNGKFFSSPNDAVYNSMGELFLTDPPYGLLKYDADPEKEIPYNGVYKVKKNGQVILLIDSLPMPNGIAFFPGEKKLLVSCTDGVKPNWYVYDVNEDSLTNGKIFYSSLGSPKEDKGGPDGLKIDKQGNVFATGPGGIWFFNSQGKLLGKLHLSEQTSNCALSSDEKTLYITNNMYVLRVKMRD